MTSVEDWQSNILYRIAYGRASALLGRHGGGDTGRYRRNAAFQGDEAAIRAEVLTALRREGLVLAEDEAATTIVVEGVEDAATKRRPRW